MIQKHPARQRSHEKIAELERTLETLLKAQTALNRKLDVRRKQFHLLVHSIHQLESVLEEEEEEEGEGEEDVMGETVGTMDTS